MLFMTKAQLKYTSFGILTIFIKLIQTTPSDVEAFDLFLPHFTIYMKTCSIRNDISYVTNHENTFLKVLYGM